MQSQIGKNRTGDVSLLMAVGLWGVFLAIQTMRHRSFFQQPSSSGRTPEAAEDDQTVRPGYGRQTGAGAVNVHSYCRVDAGVSPK